MTTRMNIQKNKERSENRNKNENAYDRHEQFLMIEILNR